MKEVILTESDLQSIKTLALNEWRDKSLTYKNADTFNCNCFVTALVSYCKSKGYIIMDGKIYVK